jgi:hypothetical protein
MGLVCLQHGLECLMIGRSDLTTEKKEKDKRFKKKEVLEDSNQSQG